VDRTLASGRTLREGEELDFRVSNLGERLGGSNLTAPFAFFPSINILPRLLNSRFPVGIKSIPPVGMSNVKPRNSCVGAVEGLSLLDLTELFDLKERGREAAGPSRCVGKGSFSRRICGTLGADVRLLARWPSVLKLVTLFFVVQLARSQSRFASLSLPDFNFALMYVGGSTSLFGEVGRGGYETGGLRAVVDS
jgi:hypothetical protein